MKTPAPENHLSYKKLESGKSLEKGNILRNKPCSATKNERNSSINDKMRQSTSRSKCVEVYNSPQLKIPKVISKKSCHLNGRSLKHEPSNADISQNINPSILNTSQALINTPLNRSLNFSKNPIFTASPTKFSSNNNLKEHIRTKTQSSTMENESQTDRHHFMEKKRKNLLKNNSSSNILEKPDLRKKMSSTSYKKGSKDQSVNVKKINLITRNEENCDKNKENSQFLKQDHSFNEFDKPLYLNKQGSNNISDGFAFENKDDLDLGTENKICSIEKRSFFNYDERKKFYERKMLKKKRSQLRKKLKIQKEKQKTLLSINKKIEENKEMINRGVKNMMKENLSLKIALDFLQLQNNRMSLNFDFLMKTQGIIVPTTEFKVFYDRILGTGGFGAVYEGVFANKKVAIKVMNIPLDYIKMILKEIITMIICDHPNLVKMFAVSFGNVENNQVRVFIIMECLKQDLKNLIFREKAHLPQKLKFKILIDVLKGISHLHEYNYVHCDLKLQNVLIDEHFNAKISDFGLANCLRSGNTKKTMIAGYSERTSAYEYLCEQKISTKGDVWSFGILMYEILNEKISWTNLTGVQVIAKVSLKTPFFDCNQKSGNKFEEEILENCLNYNHNKRPTAKDLLSKFEIYLTTLKV